MTHKKRSLSSVHNAKSRVPSLSDNTLREVSYVDSNKRVGVGVKRLEVSGVYRLLFSIDAYNRSRKCQRSSLRCEELVRVYRIGRPKQWSGTSTPLSFKKRHALDLLNQSKVCVILRRFPRGRHFYESHISLRWLEELHPLEQIAVAGMKDI